MKLSAPPLVKNLLFSHLYACNFSLKVSLQRVFCAFLAFLERKVLKDEDSKNDWIENAAIAMLDECRQLGPGLNVKEEKDDTEFWLCLPLVVRTVSMFDRRVPVDQIHQKLRAAMAVRALQMCLGIGDWDQHLRSVLSSHGETNLADWTTSSFRWRALASSVVGFLTIPSLGDTLLRDGQRCLATVENLSLCTLAGLNVEVSTNSQEHSSVVFGNQEEASLVLHVIDLLDAQGRQLGKQVSRFSTDPLFSRAEHHLSCIRGSFDLIKTAGRASAGLAGPTVSVQKRIDQMFGFAPASDDEDDAA